MRRQAFVAREQTFDGDGNNVAQSLFLAVVNESVLSGQHYRGSRRLDDIELHAARDLAHSVVGVVYRRDLYVIGACVDGGVAYVVDSVQRVLNGAVDYVAFEYAFALDISVVVRHSVVSRFRRYDRAVYRPLVHSEFSHYSFSVVDKVIIRVSVRERKVKNNVQDAARRGLYRVIGGIISRNGIASCESVYRRIEIGRGVCQFVAVGNILV